MEIRKFIIAFCFLPLSLFAQDSERFIHKGMICTRGSFAYGSLFSLKANHVYLVGGLEYFATDRVSLSGDAYFFVNSINSEKPFSSFHSIFAGTLFHLPVKGQSNVYFGIQPGINIGKATNACMGQICPEIVYPEELKTSVSPLASVVLGYRYFGTEWFHLNLDTRYIAGIFSDNYNNGNIGELRFSFSLGFNIF